MFSTSVFKGAIAAVCLISLFGVLAMPDISLIDEYSVDNSTLHRNRRGGGGQDLAEAVEALDQWSDKFKENLAKEIAQCRNFGCHKNKCWAYCTAALSGQDDEWCYTTMGSSQDRGYVPCYDKSYCDGCWKCAGPCAAF